MHSTANKMFVEGISKSPSSGANYTGGQYFDYNRQNAQKTLEFHRRNNSTIGPTSSNHPSKLKIEVSKGKNLFG